MLFPTSSRHRFLRFAHLASADLSVLRRLRLRGGGRVHSRPRPATASRASRAIAVRFTGYWIREVWREGSAKYGHPPPFGRRVTGQGHLHAPGLRVVSDRNARLDVCRVAGIGDGWPRKLSPHLAKHASGRPAKDAVEPGRSRTSRSRHPSPRGAKRRHHMLQPMALPHAVETPCIACPLFTIYLRPGCHP